MNTLPARLSALALAFAIALPATQSVADPATGPERLVQARTGGSSSLQCLTEALYFEARGEGRNGQRAVGEVILNRVDSRAFPNSVCGVVHQRGQFSYKKGRPMSNGGAASRARQIASDLLSGAPRSLTGGATYFHATHVRPSWSRKFTRTVQIGAHIFYRPGNRVASN